MRRLQELLDSNLNLLLAEIDPTTIADKSVLAIQLCIILEPKGRRHAEDLLSQLKEHLRWLLADYVDPQTDSIGYAMPRWGHEGSQTHIFQSNGLRCVTCVSSLDSFVRGFIKGAAIIGTERASRLLVGWREGQPIEFRTSAILNNLTVQKPLRPINDVEIDPLPLSTNMLPPNLPSGVSATSYLGRTVVTLGCKTSPAFFRPQTDQVEKASVWASYQANVDFRTICLALALECNDHVGPGFYWCDYQELTAFSFGEVDLKKWSLGAERLEARRGDWSLTTGWAKGGSTLNLKNRPGLQVTNTQLRGTLMTLTAKEKAKTQVAVSRWMSSMHTNRQLEDQFIDLRIALESLYLRDIAKDQRGEMRFRLALFGAWHLGIDYRDRCVIRKKLRETYDMASKAVHGGEIEFCDQNRELLSVAQDLCRRGILKLLTEGPPSDWGDLAMGIESDVEST